MSSSTLTIVLNGQNRSFPGLATGATLQTLVEALGLKADRIAVEMNGEIAPRTTWPLLPVADGGRVEIVHFVGGGAEPSARPGASRLDH